jgi:hypothetical protein
MSQHSLMGRAASEVLWHQRRDFLRAAAAWTAVGGAGLVINAAQAQSRGNLVLLQGDALLNGSRLRPEQTIQTGDTISTGPDSMLIFVMGNSAFHVRQNTTMSVERGESLFAVSLLRILSGAVISVWNKGNNRRIVTPTLTAGIRGTGVYTEVFAQQDNRSYFCNCYGTVDVTAGTDAVISQADYHQSFWGEGNPKNGRTLTPAKAINHTDEELETLAALIQQRTAWQIAGHKGVKDGMGRMESYGNAPHPAAMLGK